MHRAFLFFFTLGKNFQQLAKTLSCFLQKTFHNALENFAWTLCTAFCERGTKFKTKTKKTQFMIVIKTSVSLPQELCKIFFQKGGTEK